MFVLEIFIEGTKATLYTVRKLDEDVSETSKFFTREITSEYKDGVIELMTLLKDQMANKYGAHENFFTRNENIASGLPPNRLYPMERGMKTVYFTENPIRLYALKLSDEIAILFNGGLKLTKGAAQDDPNVSVYFKEANEFARKILKAKEDEYICQDGRYMVDYDGRKNKIEIE